MAQFEEVQIDQGTDVTLKLELVDIDGNKKNLTDYSAAAKMKKTYNTSDSDATTFVASVIAPETDGVVNLTLTNAQTSLLKSGRYVYDVELSFVDSSSNTVIERILEGQITVTPQVT
jgi:hypothetical protein|tara:strand:+ start:214 stop:564 length:351 start_codon:yes stop_codon:yes gene_type:complete